LKIKILKSFSYVSVSDPQKMQAGNVVEWPADDYKLKQWLAMKWVGEVK